MKALDDGFRVKLTINDPTISGNDEVEAWKHAVEEILTEHVRDRWISFCATGVWPPMGSVRRARRSDSRGILARFRDGDGG